MHTLITQLLSVTEGPYVTLYVPVLPGLAHQKENALRLTRMLDEAAGRLQPYGLSSKGLSQFLASARAYIDKELDIGSGAGTLALFIAPSVFHVQLLPNEIPERSVVGAHFYITPLLSHLNTLHYYVLAVSRDTAHFLEVNGPLIEAKDIPDMPRSLDEAWEGMERDQNMVQSHSTGSGTEGYHGQGGAKDVSENEAMVYLQKIAKSLHTFLHEQQQPLVFVGVKELYGIYHRVDKSGRLLTDFIHGNPDQMDGKKVLEQADPIVRGAGKKKREELLESYGNVAGTGKTSNDLAEILDAGLAGKIDLLLIAEDSEQWGTFDTESGRKELHEGPDDVNEELLGLSAQMTFRHRGQVVTVPLNEMPEGKQIAAILRF